MTLLSQKYVRVVAVLLAITVIGGVTWAFAEGSGDNGSKSTEQPGFLLPPAIHGGNSLVPAGKDNGLTIGAESRAPGPTNASGEPGGFLTPPHSSDGNGLLPAAPDSGLHAVMERGAPDPIDVSAEPSGFLTPPDISEGK